MAASTAIIGRVAIKVLPDVSEFRKDAQRRLDAAEKGLKAKVAVVFDMTGAKRELIQNIRTLNAENKAIDARKIKLFTKVSTVGLRDSLREAVREANRLGEASRVKIDAVAGTVAVELDPASLAKVKADLEAFRKANDPIIIKVKPELDLGAVGRLESALAALTRRRTVNIGTNGGGGLGGLLGLITRFSGGRFLATLARDLGGFVSNLDVALPKIGALAAGLGGLTAALLASSANVLSLGGSLAQIVPLLLAVPGILGGFAVGLGITAAAFKDFATVFPDVQAKLSALQDLISKNFFAVAEKPIRRLIDDTFPRLRNEVGVTASALGFFFGNLATSTQKILNPQLSKMFDGLNDSIEISAFATDAYIGIITRLGLVGSALLPRLATFFTQIARQFDTFLALAAGDGRLDMWIETGITNLVALGNVILSLGGIFAGLSRAATLAGGSTLVTLADSLGKIAAAVNSFPVQTALIQSFQAAFQAMDNVSTVAGPAFTNLLATIPGQLSAILPLAGTAVGQIVKLFSTLFSSPEATAGGVATFEGLIVGLRALEPAIEAIAAKAGQLGSLIGTLFSSFGPLLATAILTVVPPLSLLFEKLEPLIPLLAQGLQQAIIKLQPPLDQLSSKFVQLIDTGIVEAFIALALNVVEVLVPALSVLLGVFTPIVVKIAEFAVSISDMQGVVLLVAAAVGAQFAVMAAGVAVSMARVAASFLAPLANIAVFLAKVLFMVTTVVVKLAFLAAQALFFALRFAAAQLIALGPIGILIAAVVAMVVVIVRNWDLVKEITARLFRFLVDLFLNFTGPGLIIKHWDKIKSVIVSGNDAIRNAILSLVNFIVGLFLNFTPVGLIIKHWETIKRTFIEGVAAVIVYVVTLPGRIADAFSNVQNILVNAGRNIIAGLLTGIVQRFNDVRNKLNELTSLLPDWKGPEERDRTILFNAGEVIIGGLIDGLESRYDAVRKSLRGLTADIGDTAVSMPDVSAGSISARVASAVSAATAGGGGGNVKTLIYNAAPGSSLGSEEDLFAATSRARGDW